MSGVKRLAKRRNRQVTCVAEANDSAHLKAAPTQGDENKENEGIIANAQRQSARLLIKAQIRSRTKARDDNDSDSEASESSSSSTSDGEDDIFEVEHILDKRARRGRMEYKIRWKRGDETWEPEANLTGCSRLLQAFEEQRRGAEQKCTKPAHRRRGRRTRRGQLQRTARASQEGLESSEDDPNDEDGNSTSEDPEENEEEKIAPVRFKFGVRTEQGHRSENQDAYMVPTTPRTELSIFGVLDGHGEKGRFASEKGVAILQELVYRYYEELCAEKTTSDEVDLVEKAVERALIKVDEELRTDGESCNDEYGTTAVVCVQKGQDLIISNVGDSKAVFFREAAGAATRDKIVEVITTSEHKVSNRREAARIWSCKGQIGKDHMVYPGEDEPQRSGLAMTRALGHAILSKYGVIAAPEHYRTAIRDGDMLVIACDGLWDVLNTREVTRLVSSLVKEGKDSQTIASALVERAERKWIKGLGKGRVADNITVIVVLFSVC